MASYTGYRLQDTFFKDAGGMKGWMFVKPDSELGFCLPMGIGASTHASKQFAYLGVATHTQASIVKSLHPGMMQVGVRLDTPSASSVAPGYATLIGATANHEMFAAPAPLTPYTTVAAATSAWTTTTPTSTIRALNYNGASQIIIRKENASGQIIFQHSAASSFWAFGGGIICGSSVYINIAAAATVVLYV